MMTEAEAKALQAEKIAALKASAMEPYAAQFQAPAAPSPVKVMTSPPPKGQPRGAQGGYDARKAIMDKLLARYLQQQGA